MLHELKLIKIHKRNLGHLMGQKSHFGKHCPPHIQNSINLEREAIQEIEQNLNRRLQGLLMKAAVTGINTDPSVSIEIEDIQEYFNTKE